MNYKIISGKPNLTSCNQIKQLNFIKLKRKLPKMNKKNTPSPQIHIPSKLNWLRAGVLGANDGIVSIAGLVIGVASATTNNNLVFTAGIAGLIAGAFSMAGGEYVSVSTQKDTEKAILAQELWNLKNLPELEHQELIEIYQERGLSFDLAKQVVTQLTEKDAFFAHARDEHGINPNKLTNPWSAAFASFIAFVAGSILPILAIILPPQNIKILVCVISVIIALSLTGFVSAKIGKSPIFPAIRRNICMGSITMIFTYIIGGLFDTNFH